MDERLRYALGRMNPVTGNPVDRYMVGMLLREARRVGCLGEVRATLLAMRAEWRRRLTLTQRDWQTKVSRRPARGTHHDSWSIREKYVRISGGG
jgi:hypothetical protein